MGLSTNDRVGVVAPPPTTPQEVEPSGGGPAPACNGPTQEGVGVSEGEWSEGVLGVAVSLSVLEVRVEVRGEMLYHCCKCSAPSRLAVEKLSSEDPAGRGAEPVGREAVPCSLPVSSCEEV